MPPSLRNMLGPLKFYGQPYGTPACTGIAPALDRCVQMQGLGRGNNSIGAPTIRQVSPYLHSVQALQFYGQQLR